ncbi:GIY-YIG nuclease family protein [Patescibacteria group bacterium]
MKKSIHENVSKCPEFVEGRGKPHMYILCKYANFLNEIDYPVLNAGEFCIYILLCEKNNSLYIGHSGDLVNRLNKHKSGKGCFYTMKHQPVKLVYCEVYPYRCLAIERERQLKRWSRKKKDQLIIGKLPG